MLGFMKIPLSAVVGASKIFPFATETFSIPIQLWSGCCFELVDSEIAR